MPLDNVVENLALERIDFIKMDIEGSERWSLEGGQGTIKRFHPPMAISSYHHEDPAAVTEEVLTRISNLIQTSRPSGGLERLYS